MSFKCTYKEKKKKKLFTKPDNGNEDLFLHWSSIRSDYHRTLHKGDRVQFSIATGNNHKTKAIDVIAPDDNPLHSRPKKSGGDGGRKEKGEEIADKEKTATQ
ncbi:hypothetical protein PIB30_006352 [Stylosanthes scabra]|uniref:CSD domain-containing protein n=1 Tax=Stylosanthes scabra TaxID=79078 RepID=A0ABU6S4D6_9FABA|nr:hypothetical protein [Stylosanthes scabra]